MDNDELKQIQDDGELNHAEELKRQQEEYESGPYDFEKHAIVKHTSNGNEYKVKEFHGRVWNNESDNPKAPVAKGNINIKGEEWPIALFRNQDKSFSIVTQEPYGKHHIGGQDYSQPPTVLGKKKNEFDDDIPF